MASVKAPTDGLNDFVILGCRMIPYDP